MSKIDRSPSVKRAGSPIAGGSGSESKKRSRERVDFLEDAWLEALKFLTGQKWSKVRLVSYQLNGVVQRNVSRLPLAIIDSADIRLKERKMTEVKMIILDSTILPDEKNQWFVDRDIALDVPASIQLNNVIPGFEFKKNCCADLCILGTALEEELTPYEKRRPWFCERGLQFKTEVFFFAEFSPHRNKYFWPSMAFFLKMLYDQSTYVEEISMYALDKNVKEILFPNEEERFIRCGTFTLQVTDYTNVDKLCESVSWLEQNVRADKIEIPEFTDYDETEICVAMSNYLLGSSWISANQVVNLGHVNELKNFFRALIKKFQTMSAVQSTFPIVLFSGTRFIDTEDDLEIKWLLSGNRELEDLEDNEYWEYPEGEDESGDDRDGKTYTISNGANRMRVEFMKPPPRGPYAFKCSGSRPCAFDIRVTLEAGE